MPRLLKRQEPRTMTVEEANLLDLYLEDDNSIPMDSINSHADRFVLTHMGAPGFLRLEDDRLKLTRRGLQAYKEIQGF